MVYVVLLVGLSCLPVRSAGGQSPPDIGAAPPRSAASIRPTFSAGASILEFDASGDDAFRGLIVRAGAQLGPIVALAVSGEYWPELGPHTGWALQAEASIYPLGRRRVVPYLSLHAGRFWATLPPGTIYTREYDGLTTGLALGFHARVWDPLGVALEGLVRFDAGAGDDQLRALATYTPGIDRWSAPAANITPLVYGMMRVSGPWHFVEPGYGLASATWLNDRDALALTIALLHWQIREPRRPLVPYRWDTRAVLLLPGWRRGTRDGVLRWYLQGGPAFTLMTEGPDDELRGGASAEVGGSIGLKSLPRLTAGVGWLWIVRTTSDPAVSSTDQRGLLVHAGIAF
jgi:hypothetical protein